MKLNEAKGNTTFSLLQVGESGAGKTHRALTATTFGPVYLIDMDRKASGFAKKLPEKESKLIELKECSNAEDVVAALIDLEKREKDFATVIFDTWSAWHDFAIDHYLRNNKANRPRTIGFDGQAVESLSQPDWGAIKSGNKRMLMKLLSFNLNVIVNTHVGKSQDAEDRVILTVGTTGSFGSEMARHFPETHYLHTDMNNKRQVKGAKSGKIVANTSLPTTLLDDKGNFLVQDLSILRDLAKEIK